jgi:hypothetical protein
VDRYKDKLKSVYLKNIKAKHVKGKYLLTYIYFFKLVLSYFVLLLKLLCDSSGGMSPVRVLLTCTKLSQPKRDTLASASEAIKARPRTL